MSLQRLIDFARRQQMPLVVSDVAGREPMVILTLQHYEDLMKSHGRANVSQEEEPLIVPLQVQTSGANESEEPRVEAMDPTLAAKESEISLEERFYLENEAAQD